MGPIKIKSFLDEKWLDGRRFAFLLAFFSLQVIGFSSSACICSQTPPDPKIGFHETTEWWSQFSLDQKQAKEDLQEFTSQPHVFGSTRQKEIALFINRKLESARLSPIQIPFKAEVPNPAALNPGSPDKSLITTSGINIVVSANINPEANCVVAIASHYDTKRMDEFRYLGANDSGSSSVLLIQLMTFLSKLEKPNQLSCDIMGIWFDGEESYLEQWDDGKNKHPAKKQDNTYGSRHLAKSLEKCDFEGLDAQCLPETLGGKALTALILIDMIGSPNVIFSVDRNSTNLLTRQAAKAIKTLKLSTTFTNEPKTIDDDHIPFRRKKVSAIDLIDFTNLTFWHRPGDEVSNLSYKSMSLSGQLALFLSLNVAFNPKVFVEFSD